MSSEPQHDTSHSSPRPIAASARSSNLAQAATGSADSQPGQNQTHFGLKQGQGQGQAPREHESSPAANDTAIPFRPFFTLIEDTTTSKFHHPAVHYIFSDDDTNLITEAALRSLEQHRNPHAKKQSRDRKGKGKEETTVEDDIESAITDPFAGKLPPPVPGVQEHFIIVDVEPSNISSVPPSAEQISPLHASPTPPSTGPSPGTNGIASHPFPLPSHYKITSANSLSPTWQVYNANLAPAPTLDSALNPSTATTPEINPAFPSGGLMLKLEGTAGSSATKLRMRQKGPTAQGGSSVAASQQSLDEMVARFEKRMDELRKVMSASGHCAKDSEGNYQGRDPPDDKDNSAS